MFKPFSWVPLRVQAPISLKSTRGSSTIRPSSCALTLVGQPQPSSRRMGRTSPSMDNCLKLEEFEERVGDVGEDEESGSISGDREEGESVWDC